MHLAAHGLTPSACGLTRGAGRAAPPAPPPPEKKGKKKENGY